MALCHWLLSQNLGNLDIGVDVTEKLGIIYYVAEDNARKSGVAPNAKYISMAARHKNIFKKKWVKWLMRKEWGRRLMFTFFGKKKDNPRGFPSFVSRSDQERCQNMPWIVEDKSPYIETLKIDGTSAIMLLYVKNVVLNFMSVRAMYVKRIKTSYFSFYDENVYWQVADKLDIYNFLKEYIEQNNLEWVALQGEIAGCSLGGAKIQGDPHKFGGNLGFLVMICISRKEGKIGILKAKEACENWGIEWEGSYY